MNILKYLKCLDIQDDNEYRSYGDFRLNYLGVQKQFYNLNAIYLLLNPDADWVRELDSRLLQRNGNVIYINVHHFVSAACSYWCSELLRAGMKVLDNLQALYNFSLKNSLSMFCQSRSLTYIYEVAKFFRNLNIGTIVTTTIRHCRDLLNFLPSLFLAIYFP